MSEQQYKSYYQNNSMSVQPLDLFQSLDPNWDLITALKYLVRFKDKGCSIEDLNKAKFYIQNHKDLSKNKEYLINLFSKNKIINLFINCLENNNFNPILQEIDYLIELEKENKKQQ